MKSFGANKPIKDGTPLVFCDGSKIYEKLATKYNTHKKGYYILAPSGSGKTYFIDRQENPDWMDGDVLWVAGGSHPDGEWWRKDLADIIEIERRSDIITIQAKKLGFWIIGSDNYDIIPDAIVIPPWNTHKQYIKNRELNNYDGGLTSDQAELFKGSRKWISRHVRNGVPKFESVAEAAAFLAAKA